MKALQWYLDSFRGLSKEIWLLSLVTLINRSGTIVILFLSIYMIEQLGFSKGQAAIVLSCTGVGSFIGAYVGGILTDQIGYYKVMFGSLFLSGLMFFGLMYITDFKTLCISFTFLGIIGDAFRPASAASFSVYEKKEHQSRALSLYRLAINMGFIVGSSAAGIIAGTIGYKWLFILDGVSCVLAALLLLATLDNREDMISEEKKEDQTGGRSPYSDRWYILFLSALFLSSLTFMQLFSTFPVYCREVLKMSEEGFGLYIGFNGVIICALEMPFIFLLVKYKKEIPAIIWGVVLFGASYLIFNLFGIHWTMLALFMIIFAIAEILNLPLTYKMALNRSSPRTRGQYMGMFSMMYSIAHIVGPQGLKFAESYGFSSLWYLCVVLNVISALALLGLRKGMRD